jgi:hypothetical protein
MNKLKLIILTTLLVAIFVQQSCSKAHDDKCLSFVKAPVTKVEGPNTGTINQDLTLEVSFGCFNGCGRFGNFEQTSNNDTTTINVIAKYEGCMCTQDAPIRQTTYNFKATEKGTYYLKFWQAEKGYLLYTVQIN